MIAFPFLVLLLSIDPLVIVLLFVLLLVRALGMSVIGIPLWTKTQTMTEGLLEL
jgi:hypothetical protein